MTDLISRLRSLRKRAQNLNVTILRDLSPFLGPELFRRLPDSDEIGNSTTTCSCLMALADSGEPLKSFKELFNEEDDENAKERTQKRITDVFKKIVGGPWTSSGLLDGNAFSSLLILRTAGLLFKCREPLLIELPLRMVHTFKPDVDQRNEVAKPFSVGQEQNLEEIIKTFSEDMPQLFSVDEYPPTSAIAYWFVDAAEKLEIAIPKERWQPVISWASSNLTRQVSLDTSSHDAMKDPVEMAMAASLCRRLKRVVASRNLEFDDALKGFIPSDIELHDIVLMAFGAQHLSGIWPKYFPLFNYRKGGAGSNYLFSFELLEVIIEEFGESELIESPDVLSGIERSIDWCASNRLSYKYKNETYRGWNSGGQLTSLSQGKPESWATAMVHMYLRKLASALSSRINRRVLLKYGVVPDVVEQNCKPWNRFIDSPVRLPDENSTVKTLIRRELLTEVERSEFPSQTKISGRRSALLFGPPGTSKTSLVRAIAKKTGWPLVELNPSNFLGGGMENIYSKAEEIFDDLNDLSWAVVFFDEMDALASSRDQPSIDVTRQLLTTSMLPKLSKLYDQGRVIFFMATNHQKDFDAAIKRPRRFDLLLCMSPPLTRTKIDELQQFLPGVTTADIDYIKDRLKKWTSSNGEVASDLDLFTFDEFRIFLDRIARSSTSLRAAFEAMTEEQFAKLVKTWASSYIALSDPGAKKEFIDDKQASRIQ